MFPTITDLSVNDNKSILSASKDSEKISVLYRKLANDQSDITKSWERTLSRIIDKHNGHDKPTEIELGNDNSRESYLRPKAINTQTTANRTLDRIISRHTPEREEPYAFNRDNDNLQDFYTLNRREPTEEDHQETMSRIFTRQAEHTATKGDEKFAEEASQKDGNLLKSIDNTTTNILDVLKQMFHSIGDLVEANSVDSLRAREKAIESGNKSSHLDKDSLSDALSRALNGDKDKEEKEDNLEVKAAKIAKGIKFGAGAAIAGITGTIASSVVPQHKAEPGGGFDGSRQTAEEKGVGRKSGSLPARQKAPPPPTSGVEPLERPSATPSMDIGRVSEKYESSGQGVGTISSGLRDEGGASYGRHQLSAKDGMPEFLASEEGKPFKAFFAGLKPGTKAFNDRYKQLVKQHGKELDAAQQAYFLRKYYKPTADYARKKGIDVSQPGIQEALYSMLQHGMPGRKKIINATVKSGVNLNDPDAVIKELYDERGKYASHHASYNATIGRYKREVKDALSVQHSQRGRALNEASRQDSAKPPVIVVNSPTTINQKGGQQQTQKGPTKPAIPPVRSHFWDGWSKYFSL